MDAATRRRVRSRAGDRCEYCRLPQEADQFLTFHIEHVVAKQHGGGDELSNLALACHHCNLHKGPNLSGIDAATGQIVTLFNPRAQRWEEHFELHDDLVVGLTRTGRATVRVLAMNADDQRQLRAQWE